MSVKNAVLAVDEAPTLNAQASMALDLQKKIEGITKVLDPIKDAFREACARFGNNGFTIEVAGKGKVSVAKSSPGG